jgi:Ankyrin repeats (3 copies)
VTPGARSDNLRLFLAVRRGDGRAVEDLLDRRPELVDAVEAWSAGEAREARVPRAAGVPVLVRAAEREDLAIVRALVERGADVDQGRPGALWIAVAAHYPDIVRCLLEAGADVDAAPPVSGHTPLHVAAMRGRDELVELLLAHGADPERRDAAGRRPLDWARQNGHRSAAGLLAAAPSPVRPDGGGRRATHRARRPGGGPLTVVVMAHPARLDAAEGLRRSHPELELEVVVDPLPAGRPSALRTARVAWSAVGRGASHHLVVQDDVALCPGFPGRVRAAIEAAPRAALGFFTEWGSRTSSVLRLAALLGKSWAEVADPAVPTQALVLPADVAAGFDEFAEREPGDDLMDDTVMRSYLRALGVPALVSVPNLVEHDLAPSLLGNDARLGRRRSAWYDPGPPAPGEWERGVAAPTLLPFVRWDSGRTLSDVREVAGRGEWQRIGTAQLLGFRGLHPGEIDQALRGALAALDPGAGIEAAVGPGPLRSLWLTALALGVSLAELWTERSGASTIDEALAAPAARAALSTMPMGTLRLLCGEQVLTEYGGRLTDLAAAAVRHGFERAQEASE